MSEETKNSEKLITDSKVNESQDELEKTEIDKNDVKAKLIEKLEQAIKNKGFDPTSIVFNTNTLNKLTQNTGEFLTDSLVDEFLIDTKNFTVNLQENKFVENNNDVNLEISSKNINTQNFLKINSENDMKISLNNEIKNSDDSFTNNCNLIQNQNDYNEKNNLEDTHLKKETFFEDSKKTDFQGFQNLISKKTSVSVKPKLMYKTDEQDLAASVWIRGISNTTKAADLKTLFSKHGKVITAKIFTTKNKLSPICFGYITMSNFTEADVCIQKLNRTNLKGKVITVEKASRSLLPQINKAGKTALSSSSSLSKSVDLDISQTNKKRTLSEISCVDNKIKTKNEDLNQNSSETKQDSVKSSKNLSNNSKLSISNSTSIVKTSTDSSDKTKKLSSLLSTNRPRIISTTKSSKNSNFTGANNTSTTIKSRKIEPPINIHKNFTINSSSRMKKTTATSSSNRTARNISRRVVANSKARMYRLSATNSYVFSSRNKDLLRFKKTASGIRAERNVHNRLVSRITSRYSRNHCSNMSLANSNNRMNNPRLRLHDSRADNSNRNNRQRQSLSWYESKDNCDKKMSSRERDEMLRLMRKREDEYRKKEEELKLQRERERMRFERERLEREKLEIQQLKLTAQLANAQLAFLPQVNANTTQQSISNALAGVNLPELSGAGGEINHGRINKSITKHSSSFGRTESGSSSSRQDRHNSGDNRSKTKSRSRAISRSRSPHRTSSSVTKYERESCHKSCHNRASYVKFSSTKHCESLSSKHRGSSTSTHRRSLASTNHESLLSSQPRSLSKSNNNNYNKNCYKWYNENDNVSYINNNEVKKYNEASNFGERRGRANSRDCSPARRENQKRDSQLYMNNNVYHQPTSSRTINENLNTTSSFSTRTDPLCTSRVGNNNTVSTMNTDEMFGYGNNHYTNSGNRSDSNYMSTRITGSSNTFRNSIPSTYQSTLNVSGTNSNSHWNNNRTHYVDSMSGWSGITNSTLLNEGWTGNVSRGDWNNSYAIQQSLNNSISNGRYGNLNGIPFSSRRY